MPEYIHGEAFSLMWYKCNHCYHTERIWNSRDGITAFTTTCPSCGTRMALQHVDWNRDEHAPNHKLNWGQRFWRDGTPDEAEKFMRMRIEKMKGTEFEASEEYAAKLIADARNPKNVHDEFRPGWPVLDIYLGDEK